MAMPTIQVGKLTYAGVQGVYFLFIIIMRAYVLSNPGTLSETRICRDPRTISEGYHDPCIETHLTYRIAWAFSSVLFIMLAISVAGLGYLAVIFGGLVTFLATIGVVAGYFFIGNTVFDVLVYFSIPSVILVVVIGIFLLINAGARIHNWWARVEPLNDMQRMGPINWYVGLTMLASVFITASLGWIFLSFDQVISLQDAGRGNKRQGMVIGVSVVMLALTVLSVMPFVKHGSLLVSSMLMAFVSTLCWGATLNHSYDVNSRGFINSAGFLVCMAVWLLIMCVAAGIEDKQSGAPLTVNEWTRMTAGEIAVGLDDLQVKSKDGKQITVNPGRTAFFFMFHASVPLTFMNLMSPNPANELRTLRYRDGHFWFYVTAIILTMLIYLTYLLVPGLSKKREKPTIHTPIVTKPTSKDLEDMRFLDPVTDRNAAVGLRVIRGREWDHGDQDGGEGSEGTLMTDLQGDWWMVRWDSGVSHAYKQPQLALAPKGRDAHTSVRRRSIGRQ